MTAIADVVLRIPKARWFGAAFWFVLCWEGAAQTANEERFKTLWDAHVASPQLHERVGAFCREYLKAGAGDPLLPAVQGLLAWHLLQEGKQGEAVALLQPQMTAAGTDPVTAAAKKMASAWMTRITREQVAHALQQAYRKQVAYPGTLAELVTVLPGVERPPQTDCFGTPWKYRLTGFRDLPGFENQRYSLESETLGSSSDLATALKMPYAAGIDAVPERVVEETPPKVILRTGGRSGLLAPGQELGGLTVAFVGRKILVLANHSFWKVYPRP